MSAPFIIAAWLVAAPFVGILIGKLIKRGAA